LLAYSTFGPFFANVSVLLRDGYSFSLVESGKIMAMPSLVVCVCFPLIGIASDKLNNRGGLLVLALTILSLTQLYFILLPHRESDMHVLVPLVLNQLGYAVFITNVWPGLSNLMRSTHPDEMPDEDEEEAEDNDMSRSNMSIGIVSSLINVGNGVQPLIVGVILDRFKVQTDGAEENFKAGIKKVNLLMCVLDGVAAVTLLVWLLLKPEMINWRKPNTTTDSKSE